MDQVGGRCRRSRGGARDRGARGTGGRGAGREREEGRHVPHCRRRAARARRVPAGHEGQRPPGRRRDPRRGVGSRRQRVVRPAGQPARRARVRRFLRQLPARAAHPYPAAVDDVEAAVEWVRKHAKEYGVDRKRVGALGGSAGAHLTGLLATVGKGPLEKGHRIAAAVSWSGPMDLDSLAAVSTIQAFVGCPPEACRSAYVEASPVAHVDKTDAPMLIVNSTMELVPKAQADAMKAALDTAGVANQEIILPGTAHSRAYSNQVWDQTVKFLENYLEK